MNFYVYILYSISSGKYYVGQSSDLQTRFISHNNGESKFTSAYLPWELKWSTKVSSRKEALILERKLKNLSGSRLVEFLNKQKS